MSEHHLPALIAPLTPRQIADKMASGHSVFSPSGAEMTMTCPESLAINAIAEDTTTYEAAEGTVAHTMAERWIKRDWTRPDRMIGKTRTVADHEIEITEEMLEFVGDFVRRCEETAEGAEEWFAERTVDVSDLTPIPDQGGTMDFGAMSWGWLKIKDLKYGKEPVFAYYPEDDTINKQLAIYAWGLFLEYDWLYNFQFIELEIVQPRLPHVYSTHTITRAELIEFAQMARAKWALTWKPNAGRRPSIKGCRWCAARGKCPALYAFMAEETKGDFQAWDEDGNPIEVEVISEKQMVLAEKRILDKFEPTPFPTPKKPTELSTKALEKLLRYRKLMETYFNAILQELLNRAISDEEDLTWWKLVMSRTRRKWVDDEEFIVEALEAAGLARKHHFKTVMLSPAEMERMLHTKLKITLADARRVLEDAGLTVQPPGQKTLALMSDNRHKLPKDTDVFVNWDEA